MVGICCMAMNYKDGFCTMCRMKEMPWTILNQGLKTQKPSMTPWLMPTICMQVTCCP